MVLYFDSLTEFFSMGGHGLYVWLCYGVGMVVLTVAFIQPKARRKAIIKELAQRQRRLSQKAKSPEQQDQ